MPQWGGGYSWQTEPSTFVTCPSDRRDGERTTFSASNCRVHKSKEGMFSRLLLRSPQHCTPPSSNRIPQPWFHPSVNSSNLTSVGAEMTPDFMPQQMTLLSSLIAQAARRLVLTSMYVLPSGGEHWPRWLSPQQRMSWSVVTPHAKSPGEEEICRNWTSVGAFSWPYMNQTHLIVRPWSYSQHRCKAQTHSSVLAPARDEALGVQCAREVFSTTHLREFAHWRRRHASRRRSLGTQRA